MEVFLIGGATASGKSAFALDMCLKKNGIIINADSQQLYKSLPLLTDRPSKEDCEKAPHALYGILEDQERWDAVLWAEKALLLIQEAIARGQQPIVVGGSGFYLHVLEKGLSPIPTLNLKEEAEYYESLSTVSAKELFCMLKQQDPEIAKRLHPNDQQRIKRALCIIALTKKPLSFWQKQPRIKSLHHFKKYLVQSDNLEEKIVMRFSKMCEKGVFSEVEAFLQKPDIQKSPLIHALGLLPIQEHIEKKIDLTQCQEKYLQEVRQYAKRQKTWFRHQFTPDEIISY